jgi:hypothetical protein
MSGYDTWRWAESFRDLIWKANSLGPAQVRNRLEGVHRWDQGLGSPLGKTNVLAARDG